MPIEDKYVDADLEADKLGSALFTAGQDATCALGLAVIATADDDGSVYRLFSSVPSSLVPLKITIHNDAIAGATDYDLGLYTENRGAVIDADVLAATLDMSGARAISAENNDGLNAIGLADAKKSLAELSGQGEDADAAYDIALTANTVGGADGEIRVTAWFAYK